MKLIFVLTGLFYIITFAQADKTWETVWESPPSYEKVFFVDSMNGWIISDDGFIKHTKDGGKTWSNQEFPAEMSLWKLYFIDPDIGWIIVHIGQSSAIFYTEDGGDTWKKKELPFDINTYLLDLYFCDKDHGWVVGNNGWILHTSDGGNTWVKQDSGVRAELFLVRAIDEQSVYAAFHARNHRNAENILYTINGGKRWKILDDISAVYNIQFISKKRGYICTSPDRQNRIIYSTENGGKSWQEILKVNNVIPVQFIDDKVWWGEIGYTDICVTKDGGESWAKIPLDVLSNDAFFLSDREGWLVGDAIFHLKDGKLKQVTELANFPNCIFFLNDKLGWAGGKNLMQTTDGGNSWKLIYQAKSPFLST